jgi:hypothetical protein
LLGADYRYQLSKTQKISTRISYQLLGLTKPAILKPKRKKKTNMATKTARKSSTRKSSTRRAAASTKSAPRRGRRVAKIVLDGVKKYPFPTKAEIGARIESDAQEAITALVTINSLDAAMSSQKKLVADLAGEVKEAGKGASENKDLVSRCRAVSSRYTRRLAKHERSLLLDKNPELKPFVALFSASVDA